MILPLGRHSSVPDHTDLGRGAGTGYPSPCLPQGPWYALPKFSSYIWLCHLICEQKHTHHVPILQHSLWASTPNQTVVPLCTFIIQPHRTSHLARTPFQHLRVSLPGVSFPHSAWGAPIHLSGPNSDIFSSVKAFLAGLHPHQNW